MGAIRYYLKLEGFSSKLIHAIYLQTGSGISFLFAKHYGQVVVLDKELLLSSSLNVAPHCTGRPL